MAYRLKTGDATIEAAIRRIACEQIDAALAELSDRAIETSERVHGVRKRCKQLRGLVRLVRTGFVGYAVTNGRLRTLAAPLSAVRDADVMLETCDRVAAEMDCHATTIRARLMLNRRQLSDRIDLIARMDAIGEALAALRIDAADWTIGRDGFDALAGGLRRTYRRARGAMARVEREGSPEAFHEWRKGVKYHWCHTRLLGSIWPEEMGVHGEAAKALGELLGEHHDLDVLTDAVSSASCDYGGTATVTPFLELLARRRAATGHRALVQGRLVMAEAPDALVDRWHGYWDAWREQCQAQAPVQTVA